MNVVAIWLCCTHFLRFMFFLICWLEEMTTLRNVTWDPFQSPSVQLFLDQKFMCRISKCQTIKHQETCEVNIWLDWLLKKKGLFPSIFGKALYSMAFYIPIVTSECEDAFDAHSLVLVVSFYPLSFTKRSKDTLNFLFGCPSQGSYIYLEPKSPLF